MLRPGLLLLLLAAPMLAGCGGGDDQPGPAGPKRTITVAILSFDNLTAAGHEPEAEVRVTVANGAAGLGWGVRLVTLPWQEAPHAEAAWAGAAVLPAIGQEPARGAGIYRVAVAPTEPGRFLVRAELAKDAALAKEGPTPCAADGCPGAAEGPRSPALAASPPRAFEVAEPGASVDANVSFEDCVLLAPVRLRVGVGEGVRWNNTGNASLAVSLAPDPDLGNRTGHEGGFQHDVAGHQQRTVWFPVAADVRVQVSSFAPMCGGEQRLTLRVTVGNPA